MVGATGVALSDKVCDTFCALAHDHKLRPAETGLHIFLGYKNSSRTGAWHTKVPLTKSGSTLKKLGYGTGKTTPGRISIPFGAGAGWSGAGWSGAGWAGAGSGAPGTGGAPGVPGAAGLVATAELVEVSV